VGQVETEAIVVRTYKLAEADKIVLLLTKNAGLVRGVAKGARRLKSRFGASLEPFTVVSLMYYEKEGRELVSINQTEILTSAFALAKDSQSIATLEHMSYLLSVFLPPGEVNLRIYRMVLACLETACRSPEVLPDILLYFSFWLLKLSGFLPDFSVCNKCRVPTKEAEMVYLKNGESVICGKCGYSAKHINTEELMLLDAMRRQSPARYTSEKKPENTSQKLSELIEHLIQLVLEREPLKMKLNLGQLDQHSSIQL
jgi:DNA repair protein RecO (recombination protein O)